MTEEMIITRRQQAYAEPENGTPENYWDKINDETELIENIRQRRSTATLKKQKLSDIFTMQAILCVVILLACFIVGMVRPTFTEQFIVKYKDKTCAELEKIITDIAEYING